jgi:hypothetical protein
MRKRAKVKHRDKAWVKVKDKDKEWVKEMVKACNRVMNSMHLMILTSHLKSVF